MTDKKPDRRVQRTRELLKSTLIQLVRERDYDAVTIADITERANLGRTTFYLHYEDKDALLLDHYADFIAHLSLDVVNRDQLLGDETQPEMIAFLKHLVEGKAIYLAFTQAKGSDIVMRRIHERWAENLTNSLRDAFPNAEPKLPLELVVSYVVGAQLSLIDRWVLNRTPYSAEQIAETLHRLRRAIIRDAYGL